MKSWFASSVLLCWAAVASAASPQEGQQCLDRVDLACAGRVEAELEDSPAATRFRAALAFHRSEFEAALRLQESVEDQYGDEPEYAGTLAHMRVTAEATRGFKVERRGDVEIHYLPGVDQVLVDEAFETLQSAHDRIGPRLGGAPPGGVRLEIYPTGERFTAASGIGAAAVETTGVVALSKWTRLLVTSPRALARGYPWKDTLAHEYIHYIVAYNTADRAPVWLQEGIARSHEVLWRQEAFAELPAWSQSLLARALREDDLVTLEEMHPSMAYLPSAERAALAFAQVSTMVEHLEGSAGQGATAKALARVREGADALQAVADVATAGDRARFMADWRRSVEAMRLVSRELAAAPTVLGATADDFGIDPVLSQRQDLAGFARLGDLLQAQELHAAALVEYQKAIPKGEAPSPLLAVRLSRALASLGRVDEGVRALEDSLRDYPDYAASTKELAVLLLRQGKEREALAWYRASADINPFDPEVQGQLATLYEAGGDPDRAERHRGYRRLLLLGADPRTRPGAG